MINQFFIFFSPTYNNYYYNCNHHHHYYTKYVSMRVRPASFSEPQGFSLSAATRLAILLFSRVGFFTQPKVFVNLVNLYLPEINKHRSILFVVLRGLNICNNFRGKKSFKQAMPIVPTSDNFSFSPQNKNYSGAHKAWAHYCES